MVLISIGLTYISINSHSFYNFITNQDVEDSLETLPDDSTITDYDVTAFYDSSNLELKNVLRPSGYYFHENENFYWLNQADIQQTISAYFSSRPIIIDNPNDINQAENIYSLFEDDYLEIVFPELLPMGLLNNYLGMDEPREQDFQINQILIPFDGSQTIYLINSQTGEFVRGRLTEQLTKEELKKVVSDNTDTFLPVRRYYGNYHFIYLPIDSIDVVSQLYTLDELPDNLFISQMFSSDSQPQIVSTSNTSTIYRNYRYSLEINNATKRLDFMISRIDDGVDSNLIEGIEDSFNMIRKYEYWPGDLRITNIVNGRITYRHYLNNLPIFTAPNIPDYGSSTVHLRNDNSHDVYRFQTSLLIPQAFIDGVNQTYTLESDEEMINYLAERGLRLDEFDYATIGYEWQTDMEEFQKFILVPKWFLTFDDRHYALDQIDSDTFRNHYEEVIMQAEEEI